MARGQRRYSLSSRAPCEHRNAQLLLLPKISHICDILQSRGKKPKHTVVGYKPSNSTHVRFCDLTYFSYNPKRYGLCSSHSFFPILKPWIGQKSDICNLTQANVQKIVFEKLRKCFFKCSWEPSSHSILFPVGSIEVMFFWCADEDVLNVAPRELGIGFKGKRDYCSRDRRRRTRPCMFSCTHTPEIKHT